MDEAVLTNHIVLDTIPLDTVPGPRNVFRGEPISYLEISVCQLDLYLQNKVDKLNQ